MTEIFFTPEERIRRCLARHPDWTDKRVGGSVGVQQAAIRAVR